MDKRRILVLALLFVSLSLVAADLAITEPADIYNLGDKLYVTATGLRGYENGNLNIDLDCGNATVNLLKISARAFPEDGGQSYSIPYKFLTKEDLEIKDIKSIVGDCTIKANLAEEVVESKRFTISDKVMVTAKIDKIKYNPGEDVTLVMQVQRADGAPFIGYFETSNFTEKEGEFTEDDEGRIDMTLRVEDNKAPGSYFLNVLAYNLDVDDDVTNNGSDSVLIIVNQVPTRIEPTQSDVEAIPGESISLSPTVMDQAGGNVGGLITVHVENPDGEKEDYSIESGEKLEVSFPTDAKKGLWTVYYVYNQMTAESTFEVLGVERLNYSLTDGVLTITNVGNIDYYGLVKIGIGDSPHELEVNLKLGESKDFVLEGPDGEYEINVDDGEYSFSGTSFLTGNAVNVKEAGNSITNKISLMWIFLVFLGGSLGVIMVGMYRRSKKTGKTSFTEKVKGGWSGFRKVNKKDEGAKEDMVDLTKQVDTSAESSLVLEGDKVVSTVVSIKLKDKDDYSEGIQKEIVDIIKSNCGPKGVMDVKQDYIYLIYSPLVTRSYRNEFTAVSVGMNTSKALADYSKKMSGELKWGVGVHNGDLISKKIGPKLKYTSVGNTFSFANKMADLAEKEVLVSDAVKKRLLRDIKTHKVDEINNHPIYSVEEMKNKEANEAKLKDLLGRMGQKK